jgi:uncharacterized protein YecA (UPF0149 family)
MSRTERRKIERETAAVIRKAKADMQGWVDNLKEMPSQTEVRAWQAGYIAGLNRSDTNVTISPEKQDK